jgi:multisubunit Na+/H+ antiporter MnhB subunit
MLVYILATIMSAIFIGIAHHFYIFNKDEYILKNNKFIQKKKINLLFILFVILAILPLALVSSLRVGVGTDYYFTYYPGFYQVLGGNNAYERELIPFF